VDLSQTISQKFEDTPHKNLVVGISGIDGSGKSTLAQNLVKSLNSRGFRAVSFDIDELLNPKSIRHKNPNQVESYFEDNFDYTSFKTKILTPTRAATNVEEFYPALDLESDQVSEKKFSFFGPGILVVEGVFLFRKEIRDCFDLKIWLDISFTDAMSRVLRRTRDQRYGSATAIQARYETRFFPTQRFHLKRDRPKEIADIVADANQFGVT